MDMNFLERIHTQHLQNMGQTVAEGAGLFETGNEKVGAYGRFGF